MNWNNVSLEKLESLATALADYLALRRQQTAQSQVVALEQEQRHLTLELDEARAEVTAQRELSARLMVALKIGADGAAKGNGAGPGNRPGQKLLLQMPQTEVEPVTTPQGQGDQPPPAAGGEYFTSAEIADLDFPALDSVANGKTFDLADLGLPPEQPPLNTNLNGQDGKQW